MDCLGCSGSQNIRGSDAWPFRWNVGIAGLFLGALLGVIMGLSLGVILELSLGVVLGPCLGVLLGLSWPEFVGQNVVIRNGFV